MTDEPSLKPVIWVGTSRKDLRGFPEPVQDHVGYALYVAQRGGKHRDAKALSGFGGAGVVEIVKDYRGDIPPRVDPEICRGGVRPSRFPQEMKDSPGNTARGYGVDYATTARGRADCQGDEAMSHKKGYETGSRNVFKDIGLPNA